MKHQTHAQTPRRYEHTGHIDSAAKRKQRRHNEEKSAAISAVHRKWLIDPSIDRAAAQGFWGRTGGCDVQIGVSRSGRDLERSNDDVRGMVCDSDDRTRPVERGRERGLRHSSSPVIPPRGAPGISQSPRLILGGLRGTTRRRPLSIHLADEATDAYALVLNGAGPAPLFNAPTRTHAYDDTDGRRRELNNTHARMSCFDSPVWTRVWSSRSGAGVRAHPSPPTICFHHPNPTRSTGRRGQAGGRPSAGLPPMLKRAAP